MGRNYNNALLLWEYSLTITESSKQIKDKFPQYHMKMEIKLFKPNICTDKEFLSI